MGPELVLEVGLHRNDSRTARQCWKRDPHNLANLMLQKSPLALLDEMKLTGVLMNHPHYLQIQMKCQVLFMYHQQ